MKNFKCQLSRLVMTTLALCLGISSFGQLAGSIDTTFLPNNGGVPFSTNGNFKTQGVEVVGNSVYYAYQTEPGYPKIRKYDFSGNEDQSFFNNQMATWPGQFATVCMETEKNESGEPTGEFFISGRNSFNWGVNQGVRFLNKVNADGTRDTDFVCPYTSWISICSAIYHDFENNKLYYSFQTGTPSSYTQTIVCCDPNTGQVLQTVQLPTPTGLISKITKIPGTKELVCGGSFNFELGGHNYVGIFKLDEQMTIKPVPGITDLSNSMSISDIIFVNGSECDGIEGDLVSYFSGSISTASGVSGFRNLVRYNILGGNWSVDPIFNPGCPGRIMDICFYNCNLIATGNFASSTSQQVYQPTWTPKITAFTTDGQINEEFKTINIGAGLGGTNVNGFEGNYGQGTGSSLAVNATDDGNDNWEIFVGGSFVSWIQLTPNTILRKQNFMAKLHGFKNTIDSNFDYCIEQTSQDKYSLTTVNITNTVGCEKWELYLSEDVPFNWNLIRTENTHDFSDSELYTQKWYKLVRTVTECGNKSTTTYIIYKESVRNRPEYTQVELRSLQSSQPNNKTEESLEKEEQELVIYPNPSEGLIYITDNFKNDVRDVSVYNTIGTRILNYQFNSNNYNLDLSELSSGVYMIVVTTETGVQKQQIIKE